MESVVNFFTPFTGDISYVNNHYVTSGFIMFICVGAIVTQEKKRHSEFFFLLRAIYLCDKKNKPNETSNGEKLSNIN